MKYFDKIIIAVGVAILVIFAAVNQILFSQKDSQIRQYRVDAERAAYAMENGVAVSLSDYPTLCAIVEVKSGEDLLGGQSDYLIKSVGGRLYRFDYVSTKAQRPTAVVNISLAIMSALMLAVMLAVRFKVLMPFDLMREVPVELSKGNLTVPLKENRYRLFGRFTWGMNMLRDTLEHQKQRELELQAEKKKLIISLSHDIKIPLSAIKLYAKAIEKGLYNAEKQTDAAVKINQKADEIESFVSQIVKASNEDFLSLTVNEGVFYLNDLIVQINKYYAEKLELLGTEFVIGEYTNCLISGDIDRSVEVMQNLIENAVKYGDGKRISIDFSDEEDCRLVSVCNSGCSLSPDELPHIFDSFYRGSNVGDKDGSGLGLYICRTLMHKMKGDIFAQLNGHEISVTAVFQKA